MNIEGYKNSLGHLLGELQKFDLLIRYQVFKFRLSGRDPLDHFRWLVINDEEIDDLLSKSNQLSSEPGTESTQLEHILTLMFF